MLEAKVPCAPRLRTDGGQDSVKSRSGNRVDPTSTPGRQNNPPKTLPAPAGPSIMLEFYSAQTRTVNTARGVAECLEAALGPDVAQCDLVMIHAALGHDFNVLVRETRRLAPQARVVAASGCGVVGRDGVSESPKDIALMAIRGREFAVAFDLTRPVALPPPAWGAADRVL